ncbi:hypothetical protein LCGC14_1217530 [marine sediment metagenome]|uniref:Uncharacterized protein n=1 Tax=marine sediment metagenome TaxID=412755 RepID=A0A0F9LCA1_9ZZZZ
MKTKIIILDILIILGCIEIIGPFILGVKEVPIVLNTAGWLAAVVAVLIIRMKEKRIASLISSSPPDERR